MLGWNRNRKPGIGTKKGSLDKISQPKMAYSSYSSQTVWLEPLVKNGHFSTSQKRAKKSLLNHNTSMKLWFLFQPNSVNEVFGWNRNRYTFIVPIPAKHPVCVLVGRVHKACCIRSDPKRPSRDPTECSTYVFPMYESHAMALPFKCLRLQLIPSSSEEEEPPQKAADVWKKDPDNPYPLN